MRIRWQSPRSIWRLRLNGTVGDLIGSGNCKFAVCGSEFFSYICSQALVSSLNPIITCVADANQVGWVDFVVIDLAFIGARIARWHHSIEWAWPGVFGAIFTAGFLVCAFILYDILLFRTDAIFDISIIGGSTGTAHACEPINRGYLLPGANSTIRCTQIYLVCVRKDGAGWALTS